MKIHRIAAFTHNKTGGNPAGVVLTETLPGRDIMQHIAADVGFSETVFAAPSGDGWQTRYFSPESEVPFCGHATIALGAVLAAEKGEGRYPLYLSAGEIEVEARRQGDGYLSTLRSLPTFNTAVPENTVDEALALFGYVRGDLEASLPPSFMNAGAQHLFLALTSRERLGAMHYDLEQGRRFMRRLGLVTVAFFWREAEGIFHARNAFASGGVMEDPATGAAAAAFAGMLRDQGSVTKGRLTVLQGADMGRPSRIDVRFDKTVGSPVFVSGESAEII